MRNAAVGLQQSGDLLSGLRDYAARLVAAREKLLRSVERYELWLALVQAVDPSAEAYEVPERFVVTADLPTQEWTAEDSALVSAASDFLRRTA